MTPCDSAPARPGPSAIEPFPTACFMRNSRPVVPPQASPNQQFNHKHGDTDVTAYATEYARSNGGVGPYTVKLH